LSRNKTPIKEHYDRIKEDETYKVLIYLNNVSNGGTYFCKNKENDEWVYTNNKQGTVVIFDMKLLHKGDPEMGDIVKYALGIRLVE